MPASLRSAEPLDWLARGAMVGPWMIEGELGRGGMSIVYAVTHAQTRRRAALKLARLDPSEEPLTAACFLLEARCAVAVNHPGTVQVLEAGSVGGRPYLVMERLVGHTLGDAVDAGPIAPRVALGVLIELCDVLDAAHDAGIVHRDVKPDNVFLLDPDVAFTRRSKLLDWGVARIRSERDPWAGMMAGTPQYVSPEQARGHDVGPSCDVYALGVLTYRLFVGKLPFEAESPTRLMRMHCTSRPPRQRGRDAFPAAVGALVGAMLAKHEADRPALREVAHVLRTAQA